MRVTIIPLDKQECARTLVDGASWLNHEWQAGEFLGLERDGLEGWYDGPIPRDHDTMDRIGLPGSFWPADNPDDIGERIITIRGEHRSRPREASTLSTGVFRDWVAWLACRRVRVQVEDQNGLRFCDGLVASQTTVEVRNNFKTGFSLIVTCPDPRKYGLPVEYASSEGSVSVVNAGNIGSWPTVNIAQHVTAVTVAFGSHSVTWSGDADSLSLDVSTLHPSSCTVGSDDGFQIPPGKHDVTVSAKDGESAVPDADVSVSLASAWR